MKIILSHDIDHITVWEHLPKDLILPKFIIRAHVELFSGKILLTEYFNRYGDFLQNRWHKVDELIEFNKSKNIKSTFFIGVNNGLGLSYPISLVKPLMERIIDNQFEIGIHGIDFDSLEKMKVEYDIFKSLCELPSFGIRMHYLRINENTDTYLDQLGYLYDASEQGFKEPYKIGNMWKFPLQMMDAWAINLNKRWQVNNLKQAQAETLRIIDKANEMKLDYFSILFHDRYFSNSFKTWKNWYIWLVDYLIENNYEFITYEQAIKELEEKNTFSLDSLK